MTKKYWKLPGYDQRFSSQLIRHADVANGEPIIYRLTRNDQICITATRQPAFLFTPRSESRFIDIYLEDIGLCDTCGTTLLRPATAGEVRICGNCSEAKNILSGSNCYILDINGQAFSISTLISNIIPRGGEADLHPRLGYMLLDMIRAGYLIKTNNITQSSVLSMREYAFFLIMKRQRGCISAPFRGFGVNIVNDYMRPFINDVSEDKPKIMAITMIDFSSSNSGKGEYYGIVYSGVKRKVYLPGELASYRAITYISPEFVDYFDEEFYTGIAD